MKSPFAIFRKHARVLTVVLTGLAMFAFIVLDQIQSNPEWVGPILAGLLLGAAFWILGRPSGHSNEYGVGGLLLGVILMAFVVPNFTQKGAAVELSIGRLSEREVADHLRRIQAANQFVQMARQECKLSPAQPPFGYAGDGKDSAAMAYILRHEADEMGIALSDDAVNEFMLRVTEKKLTPAQFNKVRRNMRLSESELYDILHENLRANLALRMLVPGDFTTPAQYWDFYQRLNVKEEIVVAAIPVKDFIGGKEPSPEEIGAYFDKYKDQEPGDILSPEPAFKQPRKLQIAYLEVEFDKVREKMRSNPKYKVTDEEVQAFYEENKAIRYREQPAFDEDDPPFESPFDSPKKNGSPKKPEPTDDEPIDPVIAPEPKTGDPEKSEPALDKDGEKDSSPDESRSKPGEPESNGGQFSVDDDADLAGKSTQEADDEPAPPALPEDPPPIINYLPLDDELKADIRNELMNERVTKEATRIRESIDKFMRELEEKEFEKFDAKGDLSAEEQAAHIKETTAKVKEFAAKNKLRYVELELLGARKLVERGEKAAELWNELSGAEQKPTKDEQKDLNYLIAQATDEGYAASEQLTVLQKLFSREDNRLFARESARDPISNNQYVYWKLEDKESEVPQLDDPGVREQVVAALKEKLAREPAAKRAEALADKVRKALKQGKTMQDALEKETVTGKTDSVELTVLDTGESFSWLTTPTAQSPIAFLKPPPALSKIVAVDKAGNDFMRVAFDDLDVGEVGVAPNADATAYYIVYVKDRNPDNPAGNLAARNDFMKETLFGTYIPQFGGATSTYHYLTAGNQNAVASRWRQELLKKYEYKRTK